VPKITPEPVSQGTRGDHRVMAALPDRNVR
jgi:hypothetical protein